MHLIYDDPTVTAALAAALNNTSRTLIERIAHDAKASDLWELTCIVLVEHNDTARDFEDVLGFLPSTGPLGGEGEAPEPHWSWRERHGGWTELMITAGEIDVAWHIIMPTGWFKTRIGGR